jgi:hypothetical protein
LNPVAWEPAAREALPEIPWNCNETEKAQWPWHVLTVLVLVGLAGALYYATSLMSYEWRWNRVPQYFAYQAEESQRAATSPPSPNWCARATARRSPCATTPATSST